MNLQPWWAALLGTAVVLARHAAEPAMLGTVRPAAAATSVNRMRVSAPCGSGAWTTTDQERRGGQTHGR